MRKRMVDPAIWTDDGFLHLTPLARLLFIGLITTADDEGRGQGAAASLKAAVFPGDEISLENIEKLKAEIIECMRVVFYESGGRKYYQLCRWHNHQYVQNRKPSKIPCPGEQYLEESISTDESVDDTLTLSPNTKQDNTKQDKTKKAPAGVPATRPLYHLFEQAFVGKNQDFDYKREGRAIKALEERALARPGPEAFAKMLLVVFWQLTHGEDKWWRQQPFLPSVLASGGIYPRVLKAAENMKADQLTEEQERIIAEVFA